MLTGVFVFNSSIKMPAQMAVLKVQLKRKTLSLKFVIKFLSRYKNMESKVSRDLKLLSVLFSF